MQNSQYKRLSIEDREEIGLGIARGDRQNIIAQSLNVSSSTISRELARNGGKIGYRAHSAQKRSVRKSSTRRFGHRVLFEHPKLRAYVHSGLKKHWSPNEIVKRLKMQYPQDTSMKISHEAIYQYIYVLPRGELKKELISCLRQERKYRRMKHGRRTKTEQSRGKIADMLSIEERPQEVADRIIPGHWESDLIVGKYNRSAIATLVERVTRYTMLIPLGGKRDATTVRKAITKAVKTLHAELRKTLTYDQGKEMSQHKQFVISTGMTVYFAHPASPWERGTNENTNGLIRQYFPKGTEFDKVSTRELKRVQRELNDRPRAVLEYYKPDEIFNNLVALKV